MRVNGEVCSEILTHEMDCSIPSLKIRTSLRQVFNHVYRCGSHRCPKFIAVIKLLIYNLKGTEGQNLWDSHFLFHSVLNTCENLISHA